MALPRADRRRDATPAAGLRALISRLLDRPVPAWLLLVMAVLAALSVGRGVVKALTESGDLRMRYDTVRIMLHGENPYQLKLDGRLAERASALLGGPVPPFDPDYFPSTLLPVVPLALLPWELARAAWLLVNLACGLAFWIILFWLSRTYRAPPGHGTLAALVWLAGTPYRLDVASGQNAVFSLTLVLGARLLANRRRHRWAGLFLALGLFKYALVGPLVLFFFLLAGAWRVLAIAGAIHLAAHLGLCWRMKASPVGILGEVLGGSADIFQRTTRLTLWMPFRALHRALPDLLSRPDLVGAATVAAVVGWLVYLWRRGHARDDRLAWISALGLLAILTFNWRPYCLVFTGALWLCVVARELPGIARGRRARIAAYVVYLTIAHKLAEPLVGAWYGRRAATLYLGNAALVLLCLEFAVVFARLRPPAPEAAR